MSEITASMVKDLRERTGAGMMDCKKALNEVKGDLEAAIDWLRAKGIAKAANKSSRTAAEGLVALCQETPERASLVEVNSETDFVARNVDFQTMVQDVARAALVCGGGLDQVKAAPCGEKKLPVSEVISHMIATIGENMTVRRSVVLEASPGVVGAYLHGQIVPGAGKIGVLVSLKSSGKRDVLEQMGRQLAMHIAASSPIAMTLSEVPSDILEREKAVLREKNQGKPEAVLQKILESGLKSFAKEHCFLEQSYIHDPSLSVQQMLKEAEARVGAPVTIGSFVRFQLGEGIEKGEEDFAAEVAKVIAS